MPAHGLSVGCETVRHCALEQARQAQLTAAGVGFDWPDVRGVLAKIHEEIGELEEAMRHDDLTHVVAELGDLMFCLVNLSRFVCVHPSVALQDATDRFEHRFQKMEALLHAQGKRLGACTLEEMDRAWDCIKAD